MEARFPDGDVTLGYGHEKEGAGFDIWRGSAG